MTKQKQQISLFEGPAGAGQRELSAEMYCDGACSGNPGESGLGVVINITGGNTGPDAIDTHYTISEYLGSATNNIAEYSALIRGLEKARALGIKKLDVFLDSELIVRQMNGIYKVKNKNMVPLWNKARDILPAFDRCTITHVRRELNQEADSLARQGVSKIKESNMKKQSPGKIEKKVFLSGKHKESPGLKAEAPSRRLGDKAAGDKMIFNRKASDAIFREVSNKPKPSEYTSGSHSLSALRSFRAK